MEALVNLLYKKHFDAFNSTKSSIFEKLNIIASILPEIEPPKESDIPKSNEIFRFLFKNKLNEILSLCYDCLDCIYKESNIALLKDVIKARSNGKMKNPINSVFHVIEKFLNYIQEEIPEMNKDPKLLEIIVLFAKFDNNTCCRWTFNLLIKCMIYFVQLNEPTPKECFDVFHGLLPYDQILLSENIKCGEIPASKQKKSYPSYTEKIIDDLKQTKASELFASYFYTFERFIIKDSKSANYFTKLMSYFWLRYLYPDIYAKYFYNEKLFPYEFNPTTSDKIGYYPYCPPLLHESIAKILFKIITSGDCIAGKIEFLRSKKSYFFILEILSQTYPLIEIRVTEVISELKKTAKEIDDEAIDGYIETHLSNLNNLLMYASRTVQDELIPEIIKNDKKESEKQPEKQPKSDEISLFLSAIEEALKKLENQKNFDDYDELFLASFELIINSADILETHLNARITVINEYQKLLSVSKNLINNIFDLYLPKANGTRNIVWKSLGAFCLNHSNNSILLFTWNKLIIEATTNLSDNLSLLSTEDWNALKDPNIISFKNLPMKKEYSLQVLYDAFESVNCQKDCLKYQNVRNSEIYTTVFESWLKLLRLMQFKKNFSGEKILQAYVQTIHEVINILLQIDKKFKSMESKEYSTTTVHPPPNSTIFDIFGPLLFKFCNEAKPALMEVRNLALRVVCQVFCKNRSEVPLSIDCVAYMISIISSALKSEVMPTISTVVQNTKRIFSLDFRGLLVLIPLYADAILDILNYNKIKISKNSQDSTKNEYCFSHITVNASISILASIVVITNHYKDYKVPLIVDTVKDPKLKSMKELNQHIYGLIILTLTNLESSEVTIKIICKSIACGVIVIYKESSKKNPEADWIKEFAKVISKYVHDKTDSISEFALGCICSLGNLFPIFNNCDKRIIENIFTDLIDELKNLYDQKLYITKVQHTSNVINTLLELIMEDHFGILLGMGKGFVDIMEIAQSIYDSKIDGLMDDALMFKECIKQFYLNYPLRGQDSSTIFTSLNEQDLCAMTSDEIMSYNDSFCSEYNKEEHNNIKEAEIAPGSDLKSDEEKLYEGLNDHENSLTKHPSVNDSEDKEIKKKNDTKNDNIICLGYGSEAIISVIPSPYLETRLLIRDIIGKHIWILSEHRVVDDLQKIDYNDKVSVIKRILSLHGSKDSKNSIKEKGDSEDFSQKEMDKYEKSLTEILNSNTKTNDEEDKGESNEVNDGDTLSQILSLLCKGCRSAAEYKELIEKAKEKDMEMHNADITKIKIRVQDLCSFEEKIAKIINLELERRKGKDLKAKISALIAPYEIAPASLDYARSFLTHIGALGSFKNPAKLVRLNDSDADLRMFMRFLDTDCHFRKSIKIGVIYVRRGQFEQQEILRNSCGSPKYESVLRSLGEYVNNRGSIKVSSLDPEVLCYYNPLYEIMFHVITLMKTNYKDTQQLEKKKYVGNDSVHIVWSENDREYKAGTITGSFNFVHIIVYPMRNGLYRIKIEKKEDNVKYFGPLLSGMVVSLDILPLLLRYTAINARKSITYKSLRMFNPLSERRKTLEKTIQKYKVNTKNNQLFGEISTEDPSAQKS